MHPTPSAELLSSLCHRDSRPHDLLEIRLFADWVTMSQQPPVEHHALEHIADADAERVEATLWWMIGRMAIIRHYMNRAVGPGSSSAIMDIGCGSGGNLSVLADFGKVYGVEPSETLCRRAQNRHIAEEVFQKDALSLSECREMDVFTMFDVLEHIEDDIGFLSQLRSRATQPHSLLVSVPACPFLFGDHDRLLHHHRRYTSSMMRAALEQSGYVVREMSYFMFFLFPLVLLSRMKAKFLSRLGRAQAAVDVGELPPLLSVPFAKTLEAEAALAQRIHFPIGLWLFALAKSK